MSILSSDAMPRHVVTTHERAMRATNARKSKSRTQGKGHPATAEMDYSAREVEFMMAVEAFKVSTRRQFPTWSEVLRIVDSLGYARDNTRIQP